MMDERQDWRGFSWTSGPFSAGFSCGGRGHGGGHRRGGPFGGGPPGGFPFGPGFPWSFFRRGTRARRGDVRAAILALLAEQPRNGYQIMQELEQRSHGLWRPSPGSVYPALQLLEDEGLVTSETGAGGRTYALTDAGRAYIEAHRDEVAAPWEAMGGGADAPGNEMLDFVQVVKQVGSAVVQVATTGNPAQIAEARKVLANTRRALYRILAEEEGEESAE
jgi:DNA-binding PadR family transcriptional regulator